MSKTHSGPRANGALPLHQMQQASPAPWTNDTRPGRLRFADLLGVDPSDLFLEELQTLQSFARQVIGPHLARNSLDLVTLNKLIASVARQAQDAERLRTRLLEAGSNDLLQAEIADLSNFLDDALVQLRRQASRKQ